MFSPFHKVPRLSCLICLHFLFSLKAAFSSSCLPVISWLDNNDLSVLFLETQRWHENLLCHLLLCLFKWLTLLCRSFPRSVCTLSFVTGPDLKFQGQGHSWSVPVIPMIMSIHLWAIIISQMCFNWSYYTLLTSLPTYMDNILHFDLKSVSAGATYFFNLCSTFSSVRCFIVPTLLCVVPERFPFCTAVPRRLFSCQCVGFRCWLRNCTQGVQPHCYTENLHSRR